MDSYRVLHDEENDVWCVRNGSEGPIGCFHDKLEAIDFGRSLAQDSIFGHLVVEAAHGDIELFWSFGSDPIG